MDKMRSNSGAVEWYTPPIIIQFARAVMGGIDLDPASTPEANEVVGAAHIYTKADDGLAQSWIADRVWLNPPYGKGDVTGRWWNRMTMAYSAHRFRQGMFLANATTETRWMQEALERFPVLLLRGRLSFWRPGSDGAAFRRNGWLGSALVYMPPRTSPLWAWVCGADGAQNAPLGSPQGPRPPLDGADPLYRFLGYGRGLGRVIFPGLLAYPALAF